MRNMNPDHLCVLFCTLVSATWPSPVLSHGSTFQTTNPGNVSDSNFCFEDLCTCSQTWADCSRTFGRLQYVPMLPSNIQALDFSHNNLTRISRDDFFHNAIQIVVLHLESNGLEYISKGSFKELASLRKLCLGHNSLTYMAIAPVYWGKRLSELQLRYNKFGPIPEDWLTQNPVPPLLKLDLTGNQLGHLRLSRLSPLDQLQHLLLGDCRIYHVTSAHVPNLTHLQLQSNFLIDFPQSCSNGTSMFPMLREMFFSMNQFKAFGSEICLPNLEILYLRHNPIYFVGTDMFDNNRFPKLKLLHIECIESMRTIQQFAFRSSSLLMLSLFDCSIYFSEDGVHPDSFAGLENLEYLDISHNRAYGISNERFNQLFGSLKKLKHFSMQSSFLEIVNKNMFSRFTSLAKIDLSNNRIRDIPDGTFDSLNNLTILILSDNQIRVIHETSLSKTTQMRLTHFNINGNPFVCDCKTLWLQRWFLSSPSLFTTWLGNYTCVNIHNVPFASFHLTDQACILSPTANKAIIAFVLIFIFLLLVVSVVYHYRWHIRLTLAFRGHGEIMRRRLLEENFTYDVFLSSAEEDEAWVVQHLLPHLERDQGLRVCFHKRDFVPGKNILDNIVDGVKSSKKYVLVFSKHFALSRWCQFELDLCLGHVLDNDDALVVLLLDEAWSRDLTSTMKAVLHTTTYIRWEDRPHATASFWRRLELALAEIVP